MRAAHPGGVVAAPGVCADDREDTSRIAAVAAVRRVIMAAIIRLPAHEGTETTEVTVFTRRNEATEANGDHRSRSTGPPKAARDRRRGRGRKPKSRGGAPGRRDLYRDFLQSP